MSTSTTRKSPARKSAEAPAEKSAQTQAEQSQTGRPEDFGPGTGREAPEEGDRRYPSTVVNSDSAPLEPPKDAHTQTEPEQGYNVSSTDNVYAEAGGRTIAGEDHLGLVDQDDNDVSEGDLFDDDASKTYVTVKGRVYEQFYYANTHEKAKRLLFVPGQRVPRAQAERIKAALQAAPEPTANQTAAQRRGDDTAR